jgi:hypothetical protein
MKYILENSAKFDSYLFGSSRVGGINVASIPVLRCYNMTYSEGLPLEHFENLKIMIEENIIPNTVLIGIDDIACYVKPEEHNSQLLRMPYTSNIAHNTLAYYGFLSKYFNPVVLLSIPIMISYKGNNDVFRNQFYENGGRKNDDTLTKTDWENVSVYSLPFKYGIDNALADIQSIINICNKNNIRLILFTNPLHKLLYEKAVEHGYIDFLVRLSEITGFYNFSGINDITVNNNNYLETSHYKLTVGDLIIDTIFNHKTDAKLLSQGFGFYVTKETKTEFINLLKNEQMNQNRNLQSSGILGE